MRILFVLDEFLPENNAGAATVAFRLAKSLIKNGHKVLVLTAISDPKNIGYLEIDGVGIKRIFARPFGRFRNWANIYSRRALTAAASEIKLFGPDIVHIHSCHRRFSYGIIGLAKKLSKAVFMTLHDVQTIYNGKLYPGRCKIGWTARLKKDKFAFNPFQSFFIKKALKKTDKIFAVSEALKNALVINGLQNLEVIHNGIDVEEWAVSRLWGSKILFIGRIDEAKGAEAVIGAFNIVAQKITDAELMIVGDENFEINQNKNIKIFPWQKNAGAVKKIFAESTIVVVPSLYLDPFPTVNLEAMAAGRPIIGTCFGGTPEAVLDGQTGFIVNPYDQEALAGRIIELLRNFKKAELFGINGRKRAENVFDIEIQTEKTLFWYGKFLQ